jgi:2-polyprenyl-3-methyl-5-hydroxy-6-metoxy-1,4-benzoquinol methylase
MNCLICKDNKNVSFINDYKLEVKEDSFIFKDCKIYRCDDCDFSFVNPMPKKEDLNHYYKNFYRALNRPPYWRTSNPATIQYDYIKDKNLNWLLYLTTLIDFKKIKTVYDFGCGYGDLGYTLKKKFTSLEIFCTENDDHSKTILKERGYFNFENLDDINKKFDVIMALHSLEHLTNVDIFSKFNEMLNSNGFIFFEVPNCPQEYFDGRPYDSPHLLFFTKKSIEKIAKSHNLEFLNFSGSSYSFHDDHKFMRDSQNLYNELQESKISLLKLKKIIKKFIPNFLINFKNDLTRIKELKNEDRINWFTNNTGNNCYIRGILVKKISQDK